jgi:hypothetical protein
VRHQVFVLATLKTGETEVVGVGWPSVDEEVQFRYGKPILDLQSRDGRTFYGTTTITGASTSIVALTPADRRGSHAGVVRNQFIRYPRFVADGLTFVSLQMKDDAFLRSNGHWRRLKVDGSIVHAVPCGTGVVISRLVGERLAIARLEMGSDKIIPVSEGPLDNSPACAPDGHVVFYVSQQQSRIVHRCDANSCRPLARMDAFGLAVSPDGQRLAFVQVGNRGPVVRWMSTEGGPVHNVSDTETACRPGWTSNRTLWVSRRNGHEIMWTEVEADGGRPTGRKVPGSRDCAEGMEDPLSPVDPDVRVVSDRRSQLRLLPSKYLEEER